MVACARTVETSICNDDINDGEALPAAGSAGPIDGSDVVSGAPQPDLGGLSYPYLGQPTFSHGGMQGTGSAGHGCVKVNVGQDEVILNPVAADKAKGKEVHRVAGFEGVRGTELRQIPKSSRGAEGIRGSNVHAADIGARQKDFGHGGMAVAISKHCESKNKTVLQVAYEKGSVSKSSSGFEEARTSHVGENVGAREGVLVQSWSSLFSMPVKTGGPLQFYKPHRADGKMVVRPPVEVMRALICGRDAW